MSDRFGGRHLGDESKENKVLNRFYDFSLPLCPNTGIRYHPREYKSILDDFFKEHSDRARMIKGEQKGKFMADDHTALGGTNSQQGGLTGKSSSFRNPKQRPTEVFPELQ